MLSRTKSEESLVTLLSSGDDSDTRSLCSDQTLTESNIPIFQEKLVAYTSIRELPVVASTLKSEIMLYPSMKAVQSGRAPVLTLVPNKFHFLKKSAPLLIAYGHGAGGKTERCRIYFKILQNNLTCYVFMFRGGHNLVLYNNALKPHCDAVYKDTKLRIYGASGAASTFGNASLRLLLMSPAAASLADGVDGALVEAAVSLQDIPLARPAGGASLYDAVVGQRKSEVSRLLAEGPTLVPVPFATYIDQGGHRTDGGRLRGYIRIFEAPASSSASAMPDADAEASDTNASDTNASDTNAFSEDSLVLSTVLLTLIEQETVKMRGHNKPSHVGS